MADVDTPTLQSQPQLPTNVLATARGILGKVEGHELSDEQLSAIVGAGHNTLVLAGAGTGKTTTITGYVAWLLATKRAKPEEILVLSFTRASADEMSARIRKQTGEDVHSGTFHSLGLEICRSASLAKTNVISDGDANQVIRQAFDAQCHNDLRYRLRALKHMGEQLHADSQRDGRSQPEHLAGGAYEQCVQQLTSTALTIIRHMRSNGLDIAAMRELNRRYGAEHTGRNCDMLDLVEPLYHAYLQRMAQTQGIDFPGMITQAAQCVREGRYDHRFRYVLIDEYQDMSRPRYELIRALREQHDFSLFCVGDDWQSIYRFAGSDISLILGFDRIWSQWGATTMFRITTTRRFKTSLIEASGAFIMKDPHLYRKRLVSTSDKTDHSIKALAGKTDEDRFNAVVEQLRKLPKAASVMLLGRYRSDLELIARYGGGLFDIRKAADGKGMSVTFREKPEMDIVFMTVHAAKGLQRDYVFLLCTSGGVKGFPSMIPDEPLLTLLLPESESYPHAEERRLFYVAMTRCVKKLFIVVDQHRPSRFMYELRDDVCPNIFRRVALQPQCPLCGEALAVRAAHNDPERRFYGCTGFPLCRYSQDLGRGGGRL
ncbi:UvrD-helicase domain-containing protein [Bifidobacterium leontopitheci]|uniref:DNA 3'-5' helicase n=1 Tax=Bifidobacterium leontopitheci TaxID=2650774 RepID=A0A6I1GFT1_9BIFI|nr:UvrD-helicase domain-containing protein [Bifidobacterium leontopitheci]KAB7790484.1 helicase IV [Bifidobacterium leontopitheci]